MADHPEDVGKPGRPTFRVEGLCARLAAQQALAYLAQAASQVRLRLPEKQRSSLTFFPAVPKRACPTRAKISCEPPTT